MRTDKTQPDIIDDNAHGPDHRSGSDSQPVEDRNDDLGGIARPRRRSSSLVGGFNLLKWTVSLGLVLVVWELLARSGMVNRTLFPTVGDTLGAGVELWEAGFVVTDTLSSLSRALVGFVIGAVVGILVGVLTGSLRYMDFLLSPMITVFRPIPAIALVPLATVWFGIGEQAKWFVIAYTVFLAVWLNVHAGVSSVSETHLRVAASLGASRMRTFREVVMPAAAPDIVGGLRYGAAVAFIVLVAAELAGAQSGLGFRIQVSGQFLQTDRIFFGLMQLGVLGALLDSAFVALSSKFVHWGER